MLEFVRDDINAVCAVKVDTVFVEIYAVFATKLDANNDEKLPLFALIVLVTLTVDAFMVDAVSKDVDMDET
jgi:hypothetical protein